MADVDIKDLHKIFDRTEAVRGIDLNIKDNEFVILVGPSGLSLIHISEPTRP